MVSRSRVIFDQLVPDEEQRNLNPKDDDDQKTSELHNKKVGTSMEVI